MGGAYYLIRVRRIELLHRRGGGAGMWNIIRLLLQEPAYTWTLIITMIMNWCIRRQNHQSELMRKWCNKNKQINKEISWRKSNRIIVRLVESESSPSEGKRGHRFLWISSKPCPAGSGVVRSFPVVKKTSRVMKGLENKVSGRTRKKFYRRKCEIVNSFSLPLFLSSSFLTCGFTPVGFIGSCVQLSWCIFIIFF